MIAILDYGVGNLKSIYNMLNKIGINSIITSDIDKIKNSDKYLLPGVGSFDYGIKSLKGALFFKTLEKVFSFDTPHPKAIELPNIKNLLSYFLKISLLK